LPIRANDIETLHDFVVGVMARAGRQTTQVRAIVLAMLGGIIWRVDPGSIEIRFQDGGRANDLRWASITGYEYSCTYNQHTDQMEIHDHNVAAQSCILSQTIRPYRRWSGSSRRSSGNSKPAAISNPVRSTCAGSEFA